MAPKASLSLPLLLCAMFLKLSSSEGIQNKELQKTWCVAKPSANDTALTGIIDYSCSNVDCSSVNPGGACFSPVDKISHASIVMNLYYNQMGRNYWNCQFDGIGLISITDPSFGSCVFP